MPKSQAAIEFLLTYGWAIVVGMVVILALAYFGVLKLDFFMPSICHLPSGLSCLDYSYQEGVFTFVMKNNLKQDITIESIEADGCTLTMLEMELKTGERKKITIGCIEFKGNLKINYINKESGLEHVESAISSIKGTDANEDATEGKTTIRKYCQNANNFGMCDMLKDFCLSEGYSDCDTYKQRCRNEWRLC